MAGMNGRRFGDKRRGYGDESGADRNCKSSTSEIFSPGFLVACCLEHRRGGAPRGCLDSAMWMGT